jgi:uncharacterized damage-inducible protein DinB
MAQLDETWATDLVQLLALATKLEGRGQYNLGKLLRAGADTDGLPNHPDALLARIESARNVLTKHGVATELVPALKRGRTRMEEGSVAFIRDAPDPYVCRRCGHISLPKPPEKCPGCLASPLTFQRFRGVYWLTEMDPFEALHNLRKTPERVQQILAEAPESALSRKPSGGGWSIRNVVSHLRDAQNVFSSRVDLLLQEDEPDLAFQPVFEWAGKEKKVASTQEIFDAYLGSRQETVRLLDGIPLKDWWCVGRHEEFGRVTLCQQASYFATHEAHHLRQIEALRD